MAGVIWRILLGCLAFAFLWAIIPLVMEVLGINPGAPIMQIIRLCVAALVVIYIIAGGRGSGWWAGPPGLS